jgi:hypothetical protein
LQSNVVAGGAPGYPNPNSFVGIVASDPATPGNNTWWYNSVEGAIKGYVVNGSTTAIVVFASSGGVTVIDSNTTLSSGTYSYANLLVTNDATLTIDDGVVVNVAGALTITEGSTVTMGSATGATLTATNLTNVGTLTSNVSGDSLSFGNSAHDGTTSIAGTLYLTAGGVHVLSTSISGAGTLNVPTGAMLSVPGATAATISIATISGAGVLNMNGGATLSLAANYTLLSSGGFTLGGLGFASVPSPYTLSVSGSQTWSFGGLVGTGTVSAAVLSLTTGQNFTLGIANVVSNAGNFSWTASTHTITIVGSVTFSATGGGTEFQFQATSGGLAGTGTLTFKVKTSAILYTGLTTYTGNIVVTGVTVEWIDGRFTPATGSAATITNPLGTISGTGCFVGVPYTNTAAAVTVTYAAGTSILAGGTGLGTGTGGGNPPFIQITGTTTWTASTPGVYYLGWEDSTASTYTVFAYVYFGSTGAFVIDVQNANIGQNSINDVSGHTLRLYSSSVSAGTITTGVANTILYI